MLAEGVVVLAGAPWVTIEESVLALAGAPWVFVALFAFAVIDGFFPPVPSESLLIALAALAMSSGEPNLWLVVLVGASGAFVGDQIAYSIGTRIPVRRLRIMQGPRAVRSLEWAERALAQRGAAFIIGARYVPIGRVAVNMTAGTVGFSRPRFTLLAAIAAVTWAGYSVLLGMGAGMWLAHEPLLAIVVGVAGGLLLGVVLDALLRRLLTGRNRPAPTPETVDPGRAGGTSAQAESDVARVA